MKLIKSLKNIVLKIKLKVIVLYYLFINIFKWFMNSKISLKNIDILNLSTYKQLHYNNHNSFI